MRHSPKPIDFNDGSFSDDDKRAAIAGMKLALFIGMCIGLFFGFLGGIAVTALYFAKSIP